MTTRFDGSASTNSAPPSAAVFPLNVQPEKVASVSYMAWIDGAVHASIVWVDPGVSVRVEASVLAPAPVPAPVVPEPIPPAAPSDPDAAGDRLAVALELELVGSVRHR